ncbi:MAG: hypothetical protein K8T25_04010 [Planctomycetia bacterium]|nr:hypothetical protein [Planctomycetia bacterium]
MEPNRSPDDVLKALAALGTPEAAPFYDGGSRREGGTFGAPRRYSLATIFIVTGVCAALLGILRAAGTHPAIIGALVMLLAVVGAAQAILFRGRRPRIASLLAGAVWGVGMCGILCVLDLRAGRIDLGEMKLGVLCFMPFAVLSGYVGGTMVAGVFMLLDSVEKWLTRRRAIRPWQAEDRLD